MARDNKPKERKVAGAGDVLTGDVEEREEHKTQVDEELGKSKHLDYFDRYLFI